MMSLSTPEYAVRRIVSAISSARENAAFLKSSKVIGSRRTPRTASCCMRDPIGGARRADLYKPLRLGRPECLSWWSGGSGGGSRDPVEEVGAQTRRERGVDRIHRL